MWRKLVSLFTLSFTMVFLNLIVPGHVRGSMTIDGQRSSSNLCDLGLACGKPAPSTEHPAPSQKDRINCLICHIAGEYGSPGVIVVFEPALTTLDIAIRIRADACLSTLTIRSYDACGPPACC